MTTPLKKPVTVPDFLAAKAAGRKLSVITAYDYPTAKLCDDAGADAILVGDSLGMVVQGGTHSLEVTLNDMVYHCHLASLATKHALLVGDLPFLTYRNVDQALDSSGQLVQEGGAHAVKLEGGERSARCIEAIVAAEIPVMGHIGLTPQSVRRIGGYRVQRDEKQLIADAVAVAQAGAFAVVVECVPSPIAKAITEAVKIPTIGIGAGPHCDGQVLVFHDMLGLNFGHKPKFVKTYADVGSMIRKALSQYCEEVQAGTFPAAEHQYD